MCNFNYGRFIAQAVDSVLKQSYADLELIIVDDGSTDNSKEIIESYHDRRISTIFQSNKGQAAAFNAGFERAKGDFIAFFDSDDLWKPDKLAKMVPVIERENCSIVQHNLEIIDSRSSRAGRIHPGILPGKKNVLRAYLDDHDTDHFSATSGIICRKKDLERIFPLDISWRICADIAITVPLSLFGEVITLSGILGYYRIHGSNFWMNTEKQAQTLENGKKRIEYINQWLKKSGQNGRVSFEKTAYYKNWYIEQLPMYHHLRLRHTLSRFIRRLIHNLKWRIILFYRNNDL